jgi:hypothetical protein
VEAKARRIFRCPECFQHYDIGHVPLGAIRAHLFKVHDMNVTEEWIEESAK